GFTIRQACESDLCHQIESEAATKHHTIDLLPSSPTREMLAQSTPVLHLETKTGSRRLFLARYVWRHIMIETRLCAKEPPVDNLHQLDQQVINRPQPVNNSHRQDITAVTSDERPNDHVLHFSPSVQHGMQYRQQDQQEASHLQQASTAHHRLFSSDSPVKQHRDIYKPETPSVERFQPFQPPIQQDNYHRQLQFNEYDTVIPLTTNKYQVGTNNIQSGVNRVQPPTLQSNVPSPQQVPKPQIGSTNQQQGVNRVQQPMLPVKKGVQLQQQVQSLHQRLAQLQLGVNSYAQPNKQNPATAPVSLPQQQLHQQQPAYQQPRYQPPNFVPRTQPPTTIGHPTSMFQPPRVEPLPQGPTQSFNQQNMSSITYPAMGQPIFSRPPDISNYPTTVTHITCATATTSIIRSTTST
ncbi:Hypothetical predicted protein, partial [Mytilus galloprovincialis]